LLLVHGRTGDENVMWIFTHKLPRRTWIFSPRAPLADSGGYSWLPPQDGWPRLSDFEEIAGKLIAEFDRWAAAAGAPADQVDVMGFSQGAALAYAMAAFYPEKVNRLVALAGFLPQDDSTPGRYPALNGKRIYVAHGARDETVPVSMAQEAVRTLQAGGAQVTYCESEVGHKLSAACLRGMEQFMTGP
jgi:phospholipase/carboxylesterase